MRPVGTGGSGIARNGSSMIRIPFSCPNGPVALVESGFLGGW